MKAPLCPCGQTMERQIIEFDDEAQSVLITEITKLDFWECPNEFCTAIESFNISSKEVVLVDLPEDLREDLERSVWDLKYELEEAKDGYDELKETIKDLAADL